MSSKKFLTLFFLNICFPYGLCTIREGTLGIRGESCIFNGHSFSGIYQPPNVCLELNCNLKERKVTIHRCPHPYQRVPKRCTLVYNGTTDWYGLRDISAENENTKGDVLFPDCCQQYYCSRKGEGMKNVPKLRKLSSKPFSQGTCSDYGSIFFGGTTGEECAVSTCDKKSGRMFIQMCPNIRPNTTIPSHCTKTSKANKGSVYPECCDGYACNQTLLTVSVLPNVTVHEKFSTNCKNPGIPGVPEWFGRYTGVDPCEQLICDPRRGRIIRLGCADVPDPERLPPGCELRVPPRPGTNRWHTKLYFPQCCPQLICNTTFPWSVVDIYSTYRDYTSTFANIKLVIRTK